MRRILLLAVSFLLIFSVSGCTARDTITIGTQTYAESKILAHMYKFLLEDKVNADIEVKTDLASSPFIINAMRGNEIQLATLYTGEIFNDWFPIQQTKDSQAVLKQAQRGFAQHYGIHWFDPIGFENTYVFTIRGDVAREKKIQTISDLKKKKLAQQMKLGVDSSWLERESDGYNAFVKKYGMTFQEVFPMQISLVYKAVANKQVDIVLAYSSDPRIKEYDLAMLKDDRKFFPPYDACTVALKQTLKKYPQIEPTLKQLEGKINLSKIQDLNAKVDLEKQDPEDVARQFLQEQGLLK